MHPLVKTKWKDGDSLQLSRLDTILSVSLGGLITMAIMITSAVAFEGNPQEIDGIAALRRTTTTDSRWLVYSFFLHLDS